MSHGTRYPAFPQALAIRSQSCPRAARAQASVPLATASALSVALDHRSAQAEKDGTAHLVTRELARNGLKRRLEHEGTQLRHA